MQTNTGNMTPEEFKNMDSEERILKMASGFVTPEVQTKDQILNNILDQIEDDTPVRKIPIVRYLQAVAALAILLVGLKVVPEMLSAQQVKSDKGEHCEVVLPDGTDVVLNAGSDLKWNKKKFNEERYLTLNGEAFFDVEKGEEFVIKTKNGSVEILGTQLNVYSRGDDFWVSCIEGKVRVLARKQEKIITPGEKVKLNDFVLEKSKSEAIENTISWKNGVSHFEDTQLETIFAELERQFDVNVLFKGDINRRVTIDFSNENLEEALEVVCIPMELKYEVSNKKINISEKK